MTDRRGEGGRGGLRSQAINSQAALVRVCVKFRPGLVVHRYEAKCGAEPAMLLTTVMSRFMGS